MDMRMTRDEAISHGLSRYFTGVPCGNGHISFRYVRGGQCVRCASDRAKAIHKKRQEMLKAAREGKIADVRVTVRLSVHPADESAVKAFALALNMQRGLK